MKKNEVIDTMRGVGLVPVLRANTTEDAVTVAKTICDAGVTVLEVTMTVPGAMEVLRVLKRERPNLLLGAGTVLDPETARICIMEGAEFIVSPATNVDTIAMCRRYTIACLPGALTPTEVVNAWQAGADVIKVFPCSAMGGASYLKSLKAPLPQVELIPTGGVNVNNAMDFMAAGAFALGVGADLVDLKAVAEGNLLRIADIAKAYLEQIHKFRQE